MKVIRKNDFQVYVFILIFFIPIMLAGCGSGGGGGDSSDGSDSSTTFELGATASLGSISVGVNGSLLTIDSPDETMDGLAINIPPGSYDDETSFTISYAPITGHSGNENLNPVTPLITVENGGEYSDEILSVKIPVTIEDGYHYMAFFYDESTGELEGIPEIAHDETSLTIATRHFSKFWVNRIIRKALIIGNIDSGFQVTKDNWQFENPGTYLSPGGICSGMSLASLYYYDEKKKKLGEPQLYGRYDNGISGWGVDDEQAIKLCSTFQWWEGNLGTQTNSALDRWEDLGDQKNPAWTYLLFAHSILLTGSPQYVGINPSDDSAGHALVVYKKSGNDLYVADPNLPKDKSVTIEFVWDIADSDDYLFSSTGQFEPFESQWNKGSGKIDFTKVYYIGKTALINYNDFGNLWNKLDKQEANERFPDYDLKIIEKDATGTERESVLTDGYTTTNSVVKVKIETYEFDPRLKAYYVDSTVENNETEIVEITLLPGDNNIGFLIEAEMDSDVTNQKEWVWTDFKYFNIKYEKEDIPDPPDLPEPAEESSIIVKNTYDKNVNVYLKTCGKNGCNSWASESFTLLPGETDSRAFESGEYLIEIWISSEPSVRWIRQINLSDQDYIYDFAATQDCTKARITITNQTQLRISYKFEGFESQTWSLSAQPGETKDYYFEVGKNYSLCAQGYIGCPDGVNLSSACYSCWSKPAFTLDCEGYEWTVSGSGSSCP